MDTPKFKQSEVASAVAAAVDQGSHATSNKVPSRSSRRKVSPKMRTDKRAQTPDPVIFTARNVLMQAILDAVVHGYTHHVSGGTPLPKLKHTIDVFALNYMAFADRHERARRKRHGLGNTRALLLARGDRVEWWLLATSPDAGKHPVHETDNLSDAHQPGQRIVIDGYEIVRVPKPGSSTSKLTWRMTDRKCQGLRDYIIETVRSRSHSQMHKMLYQLYSTPGFAGIRSQVGKLVALYRAEVKRSGIKDAPRPPRHLHYLRRIPHAGVSAKELTNKVTVA